MNNSELVQSYRQQIGNVVNQANLQLFWNMYNRCGRGAQARNPSVQPPPPPGAGTLSPGCRGAESASERSHCLPRVTPVKGRGSRTSFLLLPRHGRRGP